MFLADFHIHSTFSDGKHSIPELVDFYGERGFGAIAITDHLCESRSFLGHAAWMLEQTLTEATFPLYREILRSEAARAWKRYRMLVIPGFELTKNSLSNHRSAHILALGMNGYLAADADALALAASIRGQGGLSVVAHPVSTRRLEKQTYHLWDRRDELAHAFDAWEVASGPHFFTEVAQAPLRKLASSDLHSFKGIESWKTVLSCPKTTRDIFAAIRAQNLSFEFYREASQHDRVRPDSVGALAPGFPHDPHRNRARTETPHF